MRQLFRPPSYSRAEMLLMRIGLGSIILFAFPFSEFMDFNSQPHPRGLGQWIDFSFLSNGAIALTLRCVLVVFVILYVGRRVMMPCLAFMAALMIAAGTLRNSQGGSGHESQALVLAVLGQLVAWAGYSWRQAFAYRRGGDGGADRGLDRDEEMDATERKAIFYGMEMIAATYVVAGITKLYVTQGRWIRYLPNLAIQIVKTRYQQFYNHLDPSVLDRSMPIANFIVDHPTLIRVVFGSALYLELFAFAGLANRRAAVFFGLGLLGMHLSIGQIMALHFELNMFLLLLFFINVPFLLISATKRFGASGSRRAHRGAAEN